MATAALQERLQAFGISFGSDFSLPGFQPRDQASHSPSVILTLAGAGEVRAAWDGAGEVVWSTAFGASSEFELRAGPGGDHLFTYGSAEFHLSPHADRLLCAPGDDPPADWQRVLLDTVLYCIALVRGGVALHASAVELPTGAVAIVSASGSGKTTLAVELLRRGGRLLCDDILFLTTRPGGVFGDPGPPLMNLPLGAELQGVTTPIEHFDDEPESWVSVNRMSTGAVPVRGLVFLSRRESHRDTRLAPISASPMPVLQHLVFLPHRGDAEARFRVAADLAAAAALFTLEAEPAASPATLGDLVETAISRERGER